MIRVGLVSWNKKRLIAMFPVAKACGTHTVADLLIKDHKPKRGQEMRWWYLLVGVILVLTAFIGVSRGGKVIPGEGAFVVALVVVGLFLMFFGFKGRRKKSS